MINKNKLNDLNGKEWLKLTKSFWLSEKCADDKDAMKHPAPFLIRDIEKLISMFTKEGMVIFDPFAGSGTTLIASANLKRYGIGIDLNQEYKELALERLNKKKYYTPDNFDYKVGDSTYEIEYVQEKIHYIVTSPPYHNILKNNGNGLRQSKSNSYRIGARIGVEYYTDYPNDLGNQKTYHDFLNLLQNIMEKSFEKLENKKYCSIIISDFTVDKKETNVQGDIVRIMRDIGFEFVGTIILLQNNKPLYPFGYPSTFVINHHHQNIINFRKNIEYYK
jgi:DNA modification methylase